LTVTTGPALIEASAAATAAAFDAALLALAEALPACVVAVLAEALALLALVAALPACVVAVEAAVEAVDAEVEAFPACVVAVLAAVAALVALLLTEAAAALVSVTKSGRAPSSAKALLLNSEALSVTAGGGGSAVMVM